MTTTTEVDLTGMKCPMPIVHLNRSIKELDTGGELVALADDPAFCMDVEAWCRRTGHELVSVDSSSAKLTAVIRKSN